MKYSIIFPLFFITIGLIYLPVCAQNEFDLKSKWGGALVFGSDLGTTGLNLRAEIPVSSRMALAPDIIYYFQKGVNVLEINANGQYKLNGNFVQPYVVGGLNLSAWSFKNKIEVEGKSSGTKPGLNLGGGLNMEIANFHVFTEAKFIVAGYANFAIMAGLLIPFSK